MLFIGCKNDEPKTSNNTVSDLDGNLYHTVKIGTQTWMVENLKTTKYNDGEPIPLITDNLIWINSKSSAYRFYHNDIACIYGATYNWYAVNTGKLAPIGWHVPSVAEWDTLVNYVGANLGTSNSVAKALAAKTNWTTSTQIGSIGNDLSNNNSSGFSALPGGYTYFGGEFYSIGGWGSWWTTYSSKSPDGVSASFWYLSYDVSSVGHSGTHIADGMSVRCIRDAQ